MLPNKRILELLTNKFHLFESVFGASDQVLGAIEEWPRTLKST